jgi:hypothetical protein
MACFIVPLTQAIATTVYRKTQERKPTANHSPLSAHLASLETMLYGGSLMLIVDHIISGEVTWMYPFFTALETEGGGMVMLREMLTVGLPMSVLVTVIWAVWSYLKERKAIKA